MNWKKIVSDLTGAGLSQAEIGKAASLSQPTISDLLRGNIQDVRWTPGQKLLALHKRHCPDADPVTTEDPACA